MKNQSEQIAANSAEVILGPNPIIGFHGRDVVREGFKALRLAAAQPKLTAQSASQFARELVKVAQGESTLKPANKDRRFADETWQSSPVYKRWLQGYLAWVETTHAWIDGQQGISSNDHKRLEFIADLFNDAIAPSNSPLQPVALRKFRETEGESAREGLKNFIHDIRKNGGLPMQVDKRRFKVGGNLAVTEGAVVARSELIELIQYKPLTDKVHPIPLMIVPPQINKYYVFDLSPEKSVVKGLLEAGFQVFVVSWRNPDITHADWGLAEYTAAMESAVSVACNITQQKRVNMLGACAGGITLAAFVAMRRAVGDERINSMTMLVSVLDTSALGDTALGLFASPQAAEAAKRMSARKGILDGQDIATAFAWMRPNDLIWNYWVNNILLGNAPPAFDVLYWNCDSTRLPARLHGEFIDIYKTNALTKSGTLRLHGVPVDLGQIDCDSYLLAGTTDHITPWQACYNTAQMVGGKTQFVLSNSGHIQSILNPPGNRKSEFWTADDNPPSADAWQQEAEHNDGSWWPHWHKWLGKRSGRRRDAPTELGNSSYPILCESPGTYVQE